MARKDVGAGNSPCLEQLVELFNDFRGGAGLLNSLAAAGDDVSGPMGA